MAMLQIELSVRRTMNDFQMPITHLDLSDARPTTTILSGRQDGRFIPASTPELQIRASPHHRSRKNPDPYATRFSHGYGRRPIRLWWSRREDQRAPKPYPIASSALPALGDFAIKRTNDWRRVVDEDLDTRNDMVVRLITKCHCLLASQIATECEIARESGASKESADRLVAVAR